MYGKTMSIPDNLIEDYLNLAVSFSEEEKDLLKNKLKGREENPINIKKKIAFNIVEQYHSEEEAKNAQNDFENKFQKRQLEDIDYKEIDLASINSEKTLLEFTHELLNKSKSEVRKLFEGGAISIDGEKVFDINLKINKIKKESVLRAGKLNYFKFK